MNNIINFISKFLPETPKFAIVLGSGLSSLAEELVKTTIIPFSDIPDYPEISVSGHRGDFIFGYLDKTPILCSRGRFQFYDGLSISELTTKIK